MIESQGTKNYEIFKALPYLRLLNTLSIDVVIGSILGSFLVVELFNIEPEWSFWIILPVSVWIIYTLDHIIDAFRLKKTANTYRHNFHYKHLKTISIIIVIISILDILLILFFLDKKIIYFGVSLFFATIAYLLLIHFSGEKRNPFPKEIPVSIIYACGIWGGPFALNNFHFTSNQSLLFITFFLLVFSDVLLLSYYESDSDKKDKHATMAVLYGKTTTKNIIIIALAFVYAISIFILFSDTLLLYRSIAKLYLIMGLVQVFILSSPRIFNKNNSYRYLIELIFWIPGLIVLI